MLLRFQDKWMSGYLDASRHKDAWRIEVRGWANIETLNDVTISPPRRLSTLVDYTRRVGIKRTLQKVQSRLGEAKQTLHQVIGFGQVLHPPDGTICAPNQWVGFVLTNAPSGAQRVVVDNPWVILLDEPPVTCLPNSMRWIVHDLPLPFEPWPKHTGHTPPDNVAALISEHLAHIPWSTAQSVALPENSVQTRSDTPETNATGIILFGHGHYARTCIVPYIEHMTVHTIHEYNPCNTPQKPHQIQWDTSPNLRENESAAAVWIAGFHHTHGPVAVQALEKNMWAVIEKPAITTPQQLSLLLDAMKHQPRVLIGFHKRYAQASTWLREDLELGAGKPCHYHCIVHEIPLPPRHWYNWPASGSRILSNGCHWLDHFLWLNDYCDVNHCAVSGTSGHNMLVQVTLTNGAMCSMVLSDLGSSRLGVRDVIECRTDGAMARWIDGASYIAEDRHKVLRNERLNPMDCYPTMVKTFCEIITHDRTMDAEPAHQINQLHTLLLKLNDDALAL